MKKLFSLLFCLNLFFALPLAAQNYLKSGRTAAEAALSKSASKALPRGGNITKTLRNITAQTGKLLNRAARVRPNEVLKGSAKTSVSGQKSPAGKRTIAQAIRAHLPQHNPTDRPSLIAPDEHIFQAVATDDPTVHFSGTVFAVEYNGKKEIYGVIATHAIPSDEYDYMGISRHFTAVVYHKGKPVRIPAQVVASSPVSMLDISLVKFQSDKESLLKPLSLGTTQEGDVLYTIGFAQGVFQYIPNRQVLVNSPFSIRTTIPLPRGKRSGLCGSPLLNEKNELVGIHTGSMFDQTRDYSFATPARYLRDLVAAYHNKGLSKIAFYVDEDIAIRLNSDEYVTSVMLLDEFSHALAEENISFRFSHSKISEMLKQFPQAKFLKLTTKAVYWTPNGKALLVTRDWLDDTPSKTYFYDLKEDKQVQVEE